MTAAQVLASRVRRHALDEPAGLLDATARIGGLHAQLLSSAELSGWVRGDGSVPRALWEDRTLVKTWAMRGTLHLLPAAEYPLWQAALSTYDHYLKPAWFKGFGITRDELDALIAAGGEALDGEPLTREELAVTVAEQTGVAKLGEKLRESWGGFLKPAAFHGVLCFAPNAGQNVRFTRPDRWLGPLKPVDPAAALAEVTRRYLHAYGPASRADYGRWWAISPARALERIHALGDEATETPAGWMLSADAEEAASLDPSDTVRLLPAFDPYVAGAPRSDETILAAAQRPRVFRPQGWLSPVVLVGGRIAGVWRHERKGARVVVSIEPFDALRPKQRRAAEGEAERLAEFLGGRLELSGL